MSDRKTTYGLRRGATNYSSRKFVDYDYEHLLSPSEIQWLAEFTAEYYQNTFNKETDLHSTEELRRDCYGNYNARYRDMWNRFYRVPQHFGGDEYEPE